MCKLEEFVKMKVQQNKNHHEEHQEGDNHPDRTTWTEHRNEVLAMTSELVSAKVALSADFKLFAQNVFHTQGSQFISQSL